MNLRVLLATGLLVLLAACGTENDPAPEPTETPDATPTPSDPVSVPLYFAGETSQGLRLYSETQETTESDALTWAVNTAAAGTPEDPDYKSLWPAEPFERVAQRDGVIEATLANDDLAEPQDGVDLTDELAIQQVVYTAQAATASTDPVRFLMPDGSNADQVLGVATPEPVAARSVLETLALVNIVTPGEGAAVSEDTLTVTGLSNSFEATVPVTITDASGEVVVDSFATADGWMEDQLFNFTVDLDVSGLAAGEYVLTASTDDPSDGEGPGPHVDTKTIQVN